MSIQLDLREWCMTENTSSFQEEASGSNPDSRILPDKPRLNLGDFGAERDFNKNAEISLKLVRDDDSRFQFNQIVLNHHTYKHSVECVGRRLDYLAYSGNVCIGAIGLGCPVIAMKPRDEFIGWNEEQRLRNLTKIASNWRFCLVYKGFGSRVLSKFIKQVPKDYKRVYEQNLVLIETLVEKPYTGTCYKATGFKYVGDTKGFTFEVLGSFATKEEALAQKDLLGVQAVTRKFKNGQTLLLKPIKSTPKLIFLKTLHRYWKKELLR